MDVAFQLLALLGEWEHAIRNEKDKRWAEKVFLQILTDHGWGRTELDAAMIDQTPEHPGEPQPPRS